jgi:small subunit ribosomal protein S19
MLQQKKVKTQEEVVLFNRATVITKQMIGIKFQIYNGMRFFPILVTSDMIGHRVGEFAPTRKKPLPKKKNIKK